MGARSSMSSRSRSRSPVKDDAPAPSDEKKDAGSRSRSRSRSARRSRSRSKSRSRSRSRSRTPAKREKGIACRWNDRGFGFIKPEKGGDDVFCHISGLKEGNMLREGDEVEYTVMYDERQRKHRATDVTGGVQDDNYGKGGKGGGYGGGRRYDDYDR